MTLKDQLRRSQDALQLNSQQLAAQLRITPEWLSKILNGKVAGSDDIRLRLEEVLRRSGIELLEKQIESSSIQEEAADYVNLRSSPAGKTPGGPIRVSPMVNPRHAPKADQSSREECEAYIKSVLDAAAAEAVPYHFVLRKLKKALPLDEFTPTETEP